MAYIDSQARGKKKGNHAKGGHCQHRPAFPISSFYYRRSLLFHHFPPSKYLKQTTSNYCLAISEKFIGVTLAIGSGLFTARVPLLETEPVADSVPVSVVVAFG